MTPNAHRPGDGDPGTGSDNMATRAQDTPNKRLTAALSYAERGWPVFPLSPGSKMPLIPSAHPGEKGCKGECGRLGHGFHDASVDPDQIRAWWAECPSANVGLRTGVCFDVLDVDGDIGWSTLARLTDAHGCLPGGPAVSTARGGCHHYLRATGLRSPVRFLPGLDWRGIGSYVVAPPSTFGGGDYEWAIEAGQPLEMAPTWLSDALDRPPVVPTTTTIIPVIQNVSAYGRGALESELERLTLASVGGRNDSLNASSFRLGQLAADGQIDARDALSALFAAADPWPGFSVAEAERTIASGMDAGMRNPRRVSA